MAGSGSGNKNLLVPNKNAPDAHKGYATDMRSIEQWASNLPGSGTITEITSIDASVTITNPFGPVTDLSVASSAAPYASLTGPGFGATPGDLTQAGGFTVNVPSGDTMGFNVFDSSGAGITLRETTSGAGGNPILLNAFDSSADGIIVLLAGGLPESPPHYLSPSATLYPDQSRVVISGQGESTGGQIMLVTGSGTTGGILIQDNGPGGIGFSGLIGFNAAPIGPPSHVGITTVAQLVTILQNYGLLS